MDYVKGQLVAVQDAWGQINLFRYYSNYSDSAFSVYLHFDMSTEHSHIQQIDQLIPLEDVYQLLKEHLC